MAKRQHGRFRRLRYWGVRLGALWLGIFLLWSAAVRWQRFPLEVFSSAPGESLAFFDTSSRPLRVESTADGGRKTWVGLTEISEHLIHATLASEDKNFWEHNGVDWLGLVRASWLNVRGGKVAYGASTITMQLVRRVAHTKRTVTGKMRQLVLAARLERSMDKRDILEQYINRIYYGNGAWGVEQAARLYLGKSAQELSAGEAALLAVFPRGPSYYDPFRHWPRVMHRRAHILALMHKRGYLTKPELDIALRTPISVRRHRPSFRAPHFVAYAKKQLPPNVDSGEVTTTLDWDLQERIEVLVKSHVAALRHKNLTQAAVVVLRNADGAILSMVGSSDYQDKAHNGAFNGATARLRPGSTLKPFVYGTAMEHGDTAATIAYDVVLPRETHEFYTLDVKSHGFARYREALAGSYNLSAVHTLQRVGIKTVLDKLRAAGLTTLDKPDSEYDWGLAIGHAEVTLLDLTAAFSAFGRGGVPVVPKATLSIVDAKGNLQRTASANRKRVFSEATAYQIFDILSDPDARKPMFGDRVPMNLPFKVALKTGTTKAYTDLWAVGTTAEFTVGIWAGNFDGTPTHQVMSVQGATPLMRAVYSTIAARYGNPTAPVRPPNLVTEWVCPISGKRPGPHCGQRKKEIFAPSRLPTETCDWHRHTEHGPSLVLPLKLRPWAERTSYHASFIAL